MDLSNDQLRQLREALLDAFPTQIKVAEMVRFGLNKKLDYIVHEGNLQEHISRLIIEAESEKWIDNLIFTSYEWNPENQRLRRFYFQYKAMLDENERKYASDPLSSAPNTDLEQQRLLEIAQRLLPDVMLKNPRFQFQQRTLHITCALILAPGTIDQIKAKFREKTGWTLGITLLPQKTRAFTEDPLVFAESSELEKRRLLDVAQQLLPSNVILRSSNFQFQQRTLHITFAPIIAADKVDQIKTKFRQETSWTLGITLLPQQATSFSETTAFFEKNSEQMNQRRLINMAQQLLPPGVELQNPIFQSQQRTLHITCASVLAPETVEQAKAKFRDATNWTLGITLPSQQKKMASHSSALSGSNEDEKEEKQRLLGIALQLLPQDVTLRSSILQLQQRTLHITCTPILASEEVEPIKAKFQLTTGFTLGITSFPIEWSEVFENAERQL